MTEKPSIVHELHAQISARYFRPIVLDRPLEDFVSPLDYLCALERTIQDPHFAILQIADQRTTNLPTSYVSQDNELYLRLPRSLPSARPDPLFLTMIERAFSEPSVTSLVLDLREAENLPRQAFLYICWAIGLRGDVTMSHTFRHSKAEVRKTFTVADGLITSRSERQQPAPAPALHPRPRTTVLVSSYLCGYGELLAAVLQQFVGARLLGEPSKGQPLPTVFKNADKFVLYFRIGKCEAFGKVFDANHSLQPDGPIPKKLSFGQRQPS